MKLLKIHVISNDSTVFLSSTGDAAEIFGGRYTEVRTFCKEASEFCEVTVSVICGKYGLVTSPEQISRYGTVTDSKEKYEETEVKYRYSEKIWKLAEHHDITVMFLPKDMMHIVLNNADKNTIVVSAANNCFRQIFSENGWYFFERKGARIGKKNKEEILQLLKNGFGYQ